VVPILRRLALLPVLVFHALTVLAFRSLRTLLSVSTCGVRCCTAVPLLVPVFASGILLAIILVGLRSTFAAFPSFVLWFTSLLLGLAVSPGVGFGLLRSISRGLAFIAGLRLLRFVSPRHSLFAALLPLVSLVLRFTRLLLGLAVARAVGFGLLRFISPGLVL